MSRGLGRTQIAVTDLLRFPREMTDLGIRVFGPQPTAAQRQSLRRAVDGLRSRGLVRSSGQVVVLTAAGRAWRVDADAHAELLEQLTGPRSP
jgi:hypothetical protein